MANLAPSDAMAAAALEAAARREPCARVRVRMLAVRHLLAELADYGAAQERVSSH